MEPLNNTQALALLVGHFSFRERESGLFSESSCPSRFHCSEGPPNRILYVIYLCMYNYSLWRSTEVIRLLSLFLELRIQSSWR